MLLSKTDLSTLKSERIKRNLKNEVRIHIKTATCIEILRNSFSEITTESKKMQISLTLYLTN